MTHLEDGPGVLPSPDYGAVETSDFAKAKYEAQLGAWLEKWKARVADEAADKATQAAITATAKAVAEADQTASSAAETALLKGVHDAYIATSQTSLDRAILRVNILTAAVTAVIGIYTTLLALTYYLPSDKVSGKALTGVALIPALFLGVALLLVTIYAALFRRSRTNVDLLPTGIGGTIAETRLITYMDWCFGGVLARSWALHAGIVSLGMGIISLPLPFVVLSGTQQLVIFIVGSVLILVTGVVSWLSARS